VRNDRNGAASPSRRPDAARRVLDSLALTPYLAADLSARLLPRAWVQMLARLLARLAFELRVPARRTLETNLRRLVSDASPAIAEEPSAYVRRAARGAFERFALAFVDFLTLPRLRPQTLCAAIAVDGEEHYQRARASGRGVIVLSVHAGNWEWGAAFLAARGVPLNVVARPHKSPSIESFYARRRAAWGVARLRGRPLWLAASAALRRHEWIAMMGDRPASGAHGSSCRWAAALARRTGALVLPATMTRLGDGRYLATFEPPLDAVACAEGRYRDAMLRHVRRAPGQWFAFEPLPDALLGPA